MQKRNGAAWYSGAGGGIPVWSGDCDDDVEICLKRTDAMSRMQKPRSDRTR